MHEINLSCYSAPWGGDGFIPAIGDVSETGFDGLECPASVVQLYEDRLHVFEEILQNANLKLSGLIQPVDFLDRDRADEQVEMAVNSARFLSAAGDGKLTIHHASTHEEAVSDEEWATVGAIAEEIGERCREFNIDLCFMPMSMRLVKNDKDIKRLLASTNPELVKLCIDTAEIVLAGSSPQRIIRNHFDRIGAIRLHDASASKRRSNSTSAKPGSTPQFGRGAVKFEDVSKALLSAGYSGWLTLDITGDAHTPVEAAALGFRYIIKKSGLFPV